jgi:hypothetical protein
MSLLLNQFGAPIHGNRESFAYARGEGVLAYLPHRRNAYNGASMRWWGSTSGSYVWDNVNGERFMRPTGGATDTFNMGFVPTRYRGNYVTPFAAIVRIYANASLSETTKNVVLLTDGGGGVTFGIRAAATSGQIQVNVNGFWFTAFTTTVGSVHTIAAWCNGTRDGCFMDQGTSDSRDNTSGSASPRSRQFTVGDGFGAYTSQAFGVSLMWLGYGIYNEPVLRGIAADPYGILFRRDEPFYTASSTGIPTLSSAELIDVGATTARPRVTLSF